MKIRDDNATTVVDTAGTDKESSSIAILAKLSDMVASLSSSLASITTDNERLTRIPSVIGKLKTLDKAIAALEVSPTFESIQLVSAMADLAMACLPEDTRTILENSESGSDVAMELVRRNLTQLPTLAKVLYNTTCCDLLVDEGLSTLSTKLASSLELYGALVVQGVNPRKRLWARQLTEEFISPTELRWTSWKRLMHIVGMDAVLGLEDSSGDEAGKVYWSIARQYFWV